MTVLKGWRTLIFNVLVAVGGVLVAFDWQSVVPPQWAPWFLTAAGIINMLIRMDTTTPIGRKG